MLCLNCQYGTGSSVNGDNGYDMRAGAYQYYLGRCDPVTNQSLPKITQTAVCNQGIRIPNYLYTLFWGDGAWYYEFTKQTAQLQIQSGQNSSRCAAPSTSRTSSVPPPTATAPRPNPRPNNSSNPNVGAIIGGVVGGVGLLVIAALVFWFSRRRRSGEIVDLAEGEREPVMTFEPYVDRPDGITPYSQPSSSSDHIHPNPSSEAVVAAAPVPQRPTKAGMIASGPPTRDEVGQSTLSSAPSAYPSDRHEDSAELTNAFALGRSASGRLPPTYQER
ncbi:hypothetical protein FRC08_007159 [Ceratobasidium sp. 394]|nr:hypothetical protein FRC08_007159 [Ceratobasidium sp. 394]